MFDIFMHSRSFPHRLLTPLNCLALLAIVYGFARSQQVCPSHHQAHGQVTVPLSRTVGHDSQPHHAPAHYVLKLISPLQEPKRLKSFTVLN